MSDFTPNGILYILKNVPLDPDYEKTLYFDDEQTQFDYFKSKRDTTLSWENRQYQKVGKGTLRVKALADKLYDCNYLMFQNRKYGNGNKWFYAFIREVRYINDDTSEIVYTLDVMQTWLFQYKDSMEECYVEREHTVSDELYENTIEENINSSSQMLVNEYTDYNLAGNAPINRWCACVITTEPWNPGVAFADRILPRQTVTFANKTYSYWYRNKHDPDPSTYGLIPGIKAEPPFIVNGLPVPFYIYIFTPEAILQSPYIQPAAEYVYLYDAPDTYISTMTLDVSYNKFMRDINADSIILGFFYPEIAGDTIEDLSSPKNNDVIIHCKNLRQDFLSRDGLPSYTPKNKKMYAYPYSYLTVTNNQGSIKELRFELFKKSALSEVNPNFNISIAALMSPEARVIPKDYMCGANSSDYPSALNNAITLDSFPELAFTIDTFKQYLINHGNRVAAGFTADIINGTLSAVLGGKGITSKGAAIRQVVGSVEGVIDKIATLEDKRNQANGYSGTVNTPGLLLGNNEIRFEFRTMRINGEMAKIIDEYFTRYGYKCMEIKKPNLKARPYFTYTKTIQCEINASIPQDDLEAIKGVFNMGTTFWYINEPTTGVFPQDELIGKYLTVDNQPVTTTGG